MRNFDRQDAMPPSPFAAKLLEQARQRPIAFLSAMALLDGPMVRGHGETPLASEPQRAEPVRQPEPARGGKAGEQVARFSVSLQGFGRWLSGVYEPAWVVRLPQHFEIAALAVDRRTRRVMVTVRSDELRPAADGQQVPVVTLD
jgi:hypothetical protein